MKCKICKTRLSDDTAVCYKCGYRLKFESQASMPNYTMPQTQPVQNNYVPMRPTINNTTPPPYHNNTNQSYNNNYANNQSYQNPQPTYQQSSWNKVDDNYQYKFLIGFLITIIIILAIILILVIANNR